MVMIYANDLMIMVITGAHKLLMNQEAHLYAFLSFLESLSFPRQQIQMHGFLSLITAA